MTSRPIFHDPTGRRGRWVIRATVALGAVFLAVAALFAASLVAVPVLPPAVGLNAPVRRALRPRLPHAPGREHRAEHFLLGRDRMRLLREVSRDERLAKPASAPGPASAPIVAAFYATWQETGLHSLRAHAAHLTHLMPAWLRLDEDASGLDLRDWDPQRVPHNLDVLRICREQGVRVMPVLANAHEGRFDAERAHRLLADPARQDRLARTLRDWLAAHGFAGVNVDFENLSAEDARRLPAFLQRLHGVLAPAHLALSADLEVEGNVPDARATAAACDFVVMMAYDEHFMAGNAGPLCSIDWYRDVLARTSREVPAAKLVVGIGQYAYDWTEGRAPAENLTFQEALFRAQDEHPGESPASIVDFDPRALNATYHWEDEQGRDHEVWMLDAVSAANQRTLAAARGVRGSAVWVLGSEDPAIWTFLDRAHPAAVADSSALANPSFPYDVEFEGDGELLSVAALPRGGHRALERDRVTGLYTDVAYTAFPQSYLIRRTGFRDHALALTFDDGPSADWTPRLLDALRELHAPATFFVIGENAERHPDLVERLWREGHEIGSHTYTHPNLAAVPAARVSLELNATQRVIQSLTGRSTLLFRPPYNADAEPTSAEEVAPVLAAAKLGYITVGEYLDPQDWNLRADAATGRPHVRTPEEIADRVVDEVHRGHGNAILLHDGGGDRSRTLAAIRLFVPRLRAEGWRFVTVSDLAGVPRERVMPPVSARDRALLGTDRFTFEALYWIETLLHGAFVAGIALGAARVLFVTALALVARARERRRRFDASHAPDVSVLIAAYNEQPVIARTIAGVLGGARPPIEVIVVDDGSTDGTAAEVQARFGAEPRVRLLRQPNAGKAAALNRAIAEARGDVLVCLDADTVFAPDTIEKLVRPFADPRVGAVAGNVKVGNRINVWTRWQAIEYITSQNLDRRAYALLNAITVVPGACGAWRREALTRVGGFRADTLAEDMDLTWRIRRDGWRVENETAALAWTEAPDTLATLFKQRFRWAFGTLQCLWKHRSALGRHGWFGRLALPTLWLFQIVFQLLSPLIDLQIAWTVLRVAQAWVTRGLLTRDWQPLPNAVESLAGVATLYLFFFLLELLGAVVAFRLDRERWRLLPWLFWQRFLYRQLMVAVVVRSVRTALVGQRAGWGKLQRKGTVDATAGAAG